MCCMCVRGGESDVLLCEGKGECDMLCEGKGKCDVLLFEEREV